MAFFALFYDKLMSGTEEACLRDWRKQLLSHATGNVLEIGAGTGANIDFYSEAVDTLHLAEPDSGMRKQLKIKLANKSSHNSQFQHQLSSGTAENIDAPDEHFDTVISSLVCCSVKNLSQALLEINRVLKPNGRFIFIEHVGAEHGSKRRKWQNILTPLWRKIAGNCHLNRETEQAILSAGFSFDQIERASMRKAPAIVRPTIRGVAIKQ